MKKYVLAVAWSIVFFSICALQGMEEFEDPIIIKNPEVKKTSKLRIISSHFNNPAYLDIFAHLFESYQLESAIGYYIHVSTLEKLVGDVQKNEVKTFAEYGLKKRIFPAKQESLLYTPSESYSPVSVPLELSLNTVLRTACNDAGKNEYDNEMLQEAFKKYPLEDLKFALNYPGFPTQVKTLILEAAQSKQLGKQDLDEYLDRLRFNGLDNTASRKNADEFLSIMAALPQTSKEQKKDIFCYVSGVRARKVPDVKKYLEIGGNPNPFLKEAIEVFVSEKDVKYPSNKEIIDNYKEIINYCFKKYPLYTATILVRLAARTQKREEQRIVFGIVKAHGLLQLAVDNAPDIIKKACEDLTLLQLLKDHDVELISRTDIQEKYPNLTTQPLPLVYAAVNAGNIDSLIFLKKYYGIDFSDPALINIALQSKNLATLSFVLHEIKEGLSPEERVADLNINFDSLFVDKKIFPEYGKEIYKALIKAHSHGDVQPLETLIFDMQAWKEIDKQIKKVEYLGINNASEDRISQTKERNTEAITTLLTQKFLNVTQNYPMFLDDVLKMMKRVKKNGNNIY